MHMPKINDRIIVAGLLALVLLIAGIQIWAQTGNELRGLPNFGHVTENLYRGGQPSSDGFKELHSMGVEMVVNFRDEHAEIETEKHEVEAVGIKYVGIPWNASDEPSSAQIVEFLDLVRAHPNTKIFVHCRRGADRTGTMIAAYRIAVEHKSVAETISEMHQYHYDWLFRPQLKRYIQSLPGLLQKDPQFAGYRP
jgi:tyrosine-protein phosphatase SIW14